MNYQRASKSLAPELESAAQKLREHGIVIGKVDATEEKVLAARWKVQGYPTLKYFRLGLK